MNRLPTVALLAVWLAVLPLLASAGGCSRKREYSQATPDDVIKSAVEMVRNNDAARLPTLIYAESSDMRGVLDRLGVLLGNLQRLARASAERWPEDYAALQQQAVEQAQKSGTSLLGSLGQGGRRRGGGGGGGGGNPDDLRAALNAVLADPYGWIDRNASRLSTLKTADDTATVLLDNQPIIPLVGLPMKLEGGKWYIVLPSTVPPVNQVWPRTRAQWTILGSMVRTTDQAVVGLLKDVEAGNVGDVRQLVDKFQEKAVFPLLIASVPYGREADVGARTERRVSQLRTRVREWVKSRGERGQSVSPKVNEAVFAVAPARLENLVRQNKPLGVDKLSDVELEELLEGWLREEGLLLRMGEDLSPAAVDGSIGAWRSARAEAAGAKRPPGR